jgi:hypothetical protein
LRGHLCLHWGAAMSTFMKYGLPNNNFKPSQWTRTIIRTLREYTYSQWVARNTFIHGATNSASQAMHRLSLMTQITEAYNNSSSIPIDEISFTFGIPLTLQLEQNSNIMEAWLLQFQASQKRLANILKQERRNQGKITKFLISHTRSRCPEKSPD